MPPTHDPESADADADADAPVDPATTDPAEVEAAPMNRAERRAKGKGSKQPPAIGKIQPARTNLNHGPRQYANRRGGGS